MQFLGAPHQMNHPHSPANPEKTRHKAKNSRECQQNRPDAIVQMAEQFQNVLLQYTLH